MNSLVMPAAQAVLSETHHDLLKHPALGHVHHILLGKLHRVASGSHSGGNDGNCVNTSNLSKLVEKDRVTGLVERGDPLLLGRDDMAFLLLADADPDESVLYIGLHDVSAVYSRGAYSRLVHEVLKIRSGETCSCAGDLFKIYVLAQRLISGMDLKDVLAALHIRSSHRDLPVKTARTKDRRIQNVHSVGGRHDDDPLVDAESVHFHQQLVQSLLALVVGAAKARASASRHRVDLVNEYDAG